MFLEKVKKIRSKKAKEKKLKKSVALFLLLLLKKKVTHTKVKFSADFCVYFFVWNKKKLNKGWRKPKNIFLVNLYIFFYKFINATVLKNTTKW